MFNGARWQRRAPFAFPESVTRWRNVGMNKTDNARPYYLRAYNSAMEYAITSALSHASTNHASDRATVALILRGARASGLHDYAMREAMAFRAQYKARLAIDQRHWQAAVSRRASRCVCRCCSMPQGGWKRGGWFYRHEPDKWVTRENYVTGRDVHFYASQGDKVTIANVRALYGTRARSRGLTVAPSVALAA